MCAPFCVGFLRASAYPVFCQFFPPASGGAPCWRQLAMVNIQLNPGCTTMGRDDLGGVKEELKGTFGDDALEKAHKEASRKQAEFRCSAAGVTVRKLGQNPTVGVQQATGDWEWLKEGDESRLVPGMRVTFFRSSGLCEAASFVLVQHAGAYELTTDPAPPPATAATAATAAEAAAAAAIATASAAPATAASLAPLASPPPADAAAAAPAAAADLQRDLLPTDPPIPDARLGLGLGPTLTLTRTLTLTLTLTQDTGRYEARAPRRLRRAARCLARQAVAG